MSIAPTQVAPDGTKLWLLHVGNMVADEAFFLNVANASTASNINPENARRSLVMISVLISHPAEGLILFETGAGKDYPEVWGPQLVDLFARDGYTEDMELDAQIKLTGNDIKAVKAVIIGHLHLDHAGGLDEFFGRKDVEIWVHDKELRSAFWSVATGADEGVYLKHYLNLDLNWKTFDDRTIDFCQGITLHHLPGHTDGLIGMQINLPDSGTFFFISDHCHVIENWRDGIPQGWLARDHPAWFQSTQRLKRLERTTRGRVIPGHDEETFLALQKEKDVFT
ncbi:Metallo-hydrolase/oxidoreductase [Aureobasidium pullulans]|uniref:Metallo-hydrolase/oxidoreductase n=1 Tax=Aureobasidium pullulans TaxID=5580 RepID=A0A4T0C9Q5_AURPU|nr:Metallo-hydrolase/oxidoreductase [Aureobasidium pullulans]